MSDLRENASRRIVREKQTIEAMIAIYCRGKHRSPEMPCAECSELLEYALARLDRCPFGPDKPPCAKCRNHCYRPALRDRVKAVMRYAGPRMLWKHPLLALRHQLDGWLAKRGKCEQK